jgi:hypothetical protein
LLDSAAHKSAGDDHAIMRKIFILFALVFALVMTATATVVTTAMTSDTSGLAPAAHIEAVEKELEAVPLAAVQKVAVSPKLAKIGADHVETVKDKLCRQQVAIERVGLEARCCRTRTLERKEDSNEDAPTAKPPTT